MEQVPFRLKLTGDLADKHMFEGYDGYTGLAGFARTLTLVAHYAETGAIRQKGDFAGRHAVIASAPMPGSLIADFIVNIANEPAKVFGNTAAQVSANEIVKKITQRIFAHNLGEPIDYELLDILGEKSRGNLETLAAVAEAPIRQTHAMIGAGAKRAEIISGANVIETLDQSTKDYVLLDYYDDEVECKNVNIFSFDANSGYGRLFDFELNRSMPFTMVKENVFKFRQVFSWGLDQYTRRTGNLVNVCFSKTMLMDGRAKRYHITHASKGAK